MLHLCRWTPPNALPQHLIHPRSCLGLVNSYLPNPLPTTPRPLSVSTALPPPILQRHPLLLLLTSLSMAIAPRPSALLKTEQVLTWSALQAPAVVIERPLTSPPLTNYLTSTPPKRIRTLAPQHRSSIVSVCSGAPRSLQTNRLQLSGLTYAALTPILTLEVLTYLGRIPLSVIIPFVNSLVRRPLALVVTVPVI